MAKRTALIGARTDFWLIGGASLLVRVPLLFFGEALSKPGASFQLIANAALCVLAYPHLLTTYRIAYGRRRELLGKNLIYLVVLLLLLPVAMTVALGRWSSALAWAEVLTTVTFTLAAWHHQKQSYGCFVVYCRRAGYALAHSQKRQLRGLFLGMWVTSVLAIQSREMPSMNWAGVTILNGRLPFVFAQLAAILVFANVFWLSYAIGYRNWVAARSWPPVCAWITVPALLVWWVPPFFNPMLYVLVALVFHNLQYIPFATRVERSRSFRSWIALSAATALISAALFGGLPWVLDSALQIKIGGEVALFFAVFTLTINLHHFLIDGMLWRSRQVEIQQAILS